MANAGWDRIEACPHCTSPEACQVNWCALCRALLHPLVSTLEDAADSHVAAAAAKWRIRSCKPRIYLA